MPDNVLDRDPGDQTDERQAKINLRDTHDGRTLLARQRPVGNPGLGGYRAGPVADAGRAAGRFAELYASTQAARAQTGALVPGVRSNRARVRTGCPKLPMLGVPPTG
jgi:hypothetical protein